MANARDTHGSVFERGSAVLLARVVDADGDPVTAADIQSVSYSIAEVNPKNSGQSTPVDGHSDVGLAPSSVLHATLQTPPVWTVDAVGYNFRHEVDVAQHDAFPLAGRAYQVRYELQPTSGQKVVFRFLIKAI